MVNHPQISPSESKSDARLSITPCQAQWEFSGCRESNWCMRSHSASFKELHGTHFCCSLIRALCQIYHPKISCRISYCWIWVQGLKSVSARTGYWHFLIIPQIFLFGSVVAATGCFEVLVHRLWESSRKILRYFSKAASFHSNPGISLVTWQTANYRLNLFSV